MKCSSPTVYSLFIGLLFLILYLSTQANDNLQELKLENTKLRKQITQAQTTASAALDKWTNFIGPVTVNVDPLHGGINNVPR